MVDFQLTCSKQYVSWYAISLEQCKHCARQKTALAIECVFDTVSCLETLS
jgi:hypothetical protein